MAKLSNRDVIRGIRNYFMLPLLALTMTSRLHEYFARNQTTNRNEDTCVPDTINSVCEISSPFNNGSSFSTDSKLSEFIRRVLESRILLLGFPTQQDLRHQIFESVLGAICWGACFLFIRKGCNPECRKNFFAKYWRGTCLGILSIYNGSMLRAIVIMSIFPPGMFCHYFDIAVSSLSPRLWSSMDKSEKLFSCTSLHNALVIGMCWGIGNTLVRRRLDPAMRNPPETFVQRHWKDVSCGALAIGTSSLIKSIWMHYNPTDMVEEILENMFDTFSGKTSFATWLSSIRPFILGSETDRVSYNHYIYESMRVGISWGITSLFIRRGLNPDIRNGGRFIGKYWRDALYGTLAMSCCVFVRLAARMFLERMALFLANRVDPFLGDEL
mmetsp:Transcript_27521/g.57440  ORF Transcript_27521/g.57440 Transcript_27521/m.57440 type:complete len:384 (+) Transcript_27521:355-1506(+)